MKIKIIEARYVYELEKEVNAFLSKWDPSNILDIKYSGGGGSSELFGKHLSVMIILK